MPITELPGNAPKATPGADQLKEEIVELTEEGAVPGAESTPTDDGGEIVELDGEEAVAATTEFYENLLGTDVLPELTAKGLMPELLELIDADKESRKEYDEQYAEGIKRTGLGGEAPGGATFQGASRTVHPLLSKAAIDYASRAMGELFPGGGQVVRDEVLGQSDDFNSKEERTAYAERCDKAKRIAALMNWQLVHDVPEFRAEMDKLLTQTPLAGSQFLFWAWDPKRNRPTCRYWPTDNVWFDYNASSAATAERLTLVEEITEIEFKRRVRSGEYYVPEGEAVPSSPWPEDQSEAQKATDKAQGVTHAFNARVGYHMIGRTYTMLEIEGEEHPYCIVSDLGNDRMLSCVRNWEEEDKTNEALVWATEVPFLPWRGALSMGLVQFIGSLAGAATGSMRALLDSAHLNNFPAVLRVKGANFAGQSETVEATGSMEVEGGIAGDVDIRKLMMPLPYNPPSAVLYQLLGLVTELGESFVQVALKNLAEGRNDMPVGTTLALIEQGLKTLSGIHARLHAAMTVMLKVVYRLNRMYITDDEIRNAAGVLLARREDFQGPMDVVPVSDPEVFSDAQRYAQLQMVAQRAKEMPMLYNLRKVEELILARTRIPNADALLNPEEVPEEANAVTENVKMSMGKAVVALPHQDHLAHLQVLIDFLKDPMLGMNALIAPRYIPLALQHIADHMVMWYATQFEKVLGTDVLRDETGDIDLTAVWEEKDPKSRKELDKLFAEASPLATKATADTFAQVPAIIAEAQALIQQLMPQPMTEPSVQVAHLKAQVDAQRSQLDLQKEQLKQASETARNTEDNNTKLIIARMEEQLTLLTTAHQARESAKKNAMTNGNLVGG